MVGTKGAFRVLLIMVVCIVLSGCINVTTRLQPEDPSVPAALEGSDCVPIVLGIGIGTASIEEALAEGKKPNYATPSSHPIKRIRTLEWSDYQFLFFGARCIEVVGE